ncbi:hypothetical protein KST83_10760 [Fusobacterium nucleatum]|uniref:Uncharacterized protein n=1 Tax=Fusobacterium nucleatum subsp. polymorphum TaxID=76857 RepID=A0A2C5ZAY6_FUSNP|nr:hypothetical protein [Fusobacterium polymorphum]PHH96599.1 hypothetical protein CA840_04195 [Fusobacterium polymorphum]
MEDEVLENTPGGNGEGTNTDDLNPNLPPDDSTNNDGTREKVEEKQPFSVDDIEFTEEYNIAGYDFSKFKGRIDESSLHYLEEYAKKYQEQGFTQAQIEFLMEENLSETPKDRESIMKELQSSLTVEEKQSYRHTGAQLKQALDKSNLGKYYEEIMTNPIAFKVVNALVKSLTPGANIGAKTERESRVNSLISGERGVELFNEFLSTSSVNEEAVKAKIKEIRSKIKNQEELNYFNQIVGEI